MHLKSEESAKINAFWQFLPFLSVEESTKPEGRKKTPCQLSRQRGPPQHDPTGWLWAPSPVASSLVNLHVSCDFHRLKFNPIRTRMPSVLSKLNRNWIERLIPGGFSYELALRWPDKAASTEGSGAVRCGFMKICLLLTDVQMVLATSRWGI